MIALLLFLSCTLGPPAIDDWKAEILTNSRISTNPDFDRPELGKGRGHVLILTAEWGKLPFITDTQQYLNVLVNVPLELEPGTTFSAADRAGYLRMGGMSVGYESRDLVGTITVVSTSPEGVVLDLDLLARTPIVDVDHVGERKVKGRVSAVLGAPTSPPSPPPKE